MKNLLPRVVWDFLVGAVVGVVALIVTLATLGLVAQLLPSSGQVYRLVSDAFVVIGTAVLVAFLLVIAVYEITLMVRARGTMADPQGTESRLLNRDVLVRAALSGFVAGLYAALLALVFALLARGAFFLTPASVWFPGLLPGLMLVAALALAYAYIGRDLREQQGELNDRERGTLLSLPLTLTVVLGFLFGAASGGASGVISAFVGALLTYGLIRGVTRFRGHVMQRFFKRLLEARGGPTIKLVSSHKA